jgi:hypothetical protein
MHTLSCSGWSCASNEDPTILKAVIKECNRRIAELNEKLLSRE